MLASCEVVHSDLGDTTTLSLSLWCLQDTDLFADMNSSAIDDAWQWLPLKARISLLHFLSDLPRLAGQFRSPELREQLSHALERVTQEAELTTAERSALKTASEIVVCGEEVSYWGQTNNCLLFVSGHLCTHAR